MTWVGSGIVPDTQISNTATWSPTIAAGSAWGIAVTLHTAPATLIGTPLSHTFTAVPSALDTTPADNTITWSGSVVGAVDPNEKQVVPEVMTPAQVQAGGWLEYTIRFQNTGTFPATRVIITDTLSSDLLWNTMDFVSGSHTTHWYIHRGVLHFVMEPILLPDSTNDEANSHGYVKFRMKPLNTLLNGAQIENVANIYFDFNAPVITASAVFTVDESLAIAAILENGFRCFPNPATDNIIVQLAHPGAMLELRSSDGRSLKVQRIIGAQVALHIGDLANGLYMISIEDATGARSTQRFVKQ